MIIVKYIKLNMSFCLVMTVNFVTVLAAWNNSLQKGYMGVSKCCLLDCNFLCFPCVCHEVERVPMFLSDILPRDGSKPPKVWCYSLLDFCSNSRNQHHLYVFSFYEL